MKRRLLQILEASEENDTISRMVDLFLISLISLNIAIVYAYTFHLPRTVTSAFRHIETISVVLFTVEYLLRLWTSHTLYQAETPFKSMMKYAFSFVGMTDLLAIIPFYLPMLIPYDLKVLRIVRMIRLFQIFKLTRYTSSMRSIWFVIRHKSAQLISSILVIFMLITIVSLIMYHVESSAQPDVFKNAFSGMWWAIATLTTVGYGDIYPITALGKFMASIISLLGIGFVAVPTAIISSGFIEQIEIKNEKDIGKGYHYCPHCGKKLR